MIDVCVHVIRNGRRSRQAGDVFRVWAVGDSPRDDEFPATLDPGPPKVYTPKEPIGDSRKFAFIFVTRVPAKNDDFKALAHWHEVLKDQPDDDVYVQRHKAKVLLDDLPAPRTAELNQDNHTTVTWNTFKAAMRIKLVAGGNRPADDTDASG